MNILMVLTSHDALGDTGKKTGFWVEEFAAPYYEMADAGAEITLTRNSTAWEQVTLTQKVLRDASQMDCAVELFGDVLATAGLLRTATGAPRHRFLPQPPAQVPAVVRGHRAAQSGRPSAPGGRQAELCRPVAVPAG